MTIVRPDGTLDPECYGLEALTEEELCRELRGLKPGETWEPLMHPLSTGKVSVSRVGGDPYVGKGYLIEGCLLDENPCGAWVTSAHAETNQAHVAAAIAMALRRGCMGFWKTEVKT